MSLVAKKMLIEERFKLTKQQVCLFTLGKAYNLFNAQKN